MGFIKKRGKYWYIYIKIGGKQIVRSTKTRNRKIAQKILLDIEDKLALEKFNITHIKPKQLKFFLTDYFNWARSIKSKETIRAEKLAVKKLLSIVSENILLTNITPQIIDQLKNNLIKTLDITSINIILRSLRSIFNTAIKWNLLRENPVSKAGLLKDEKTIPKALSPDEINHLIETAIKEDPEFAKLIIFAIHTGLRRKEIANLTFNNIDFTRNIAIIKSTKTKRERIIPLSPTAMSIIKSMNPNKSTIFPFTTDYISHKFKQIAIKANIPNISFHTLRKTFASYLFTTGIDLKIISLLLGHSSVTTTESHYLHIFNDKLLQAIQSIQITDKFIHQIINQEDSKGDKWVTNKNTPTFPQQIN